MSDWLYLSTGDTRLDRLLDNRSKRGFRYIPEHSLRLLVKGKPGTGKSMLVTQIALKFAKPRESVKEGSQGALYYSLDEEIPKIERRISSIQEEIACDVLTATENEFRGLENTGPDDGKTAKLRDKGGIIVLYQNPKMNDLAKDLKDADAKGEKQQLTSVPSKISWGRIAKLAKRIEKDVAKSQKVLGWSRSLVIVDSVNAMFESEEVLRSALRSLTHGLKALIENCCFVFVAETNGQTIAEEYLTDSVILMGMEENSGARFLTITKARDHDVRPAKQPLLIDSQGVRIIPRAVRTEALKREESDLCIFGEDKLDDLLKPTFGLGEDPGKVTEPVSGIYRGSSTLLVGPSGTRKTLIALQFISGGMSGKDKDRAVIISFSPQESGFLHFYGGLFSQDDKDFFGTLFLPMPSLLEDVEDEIIRNTIEVCSNEKPYRVVIHDIGDLLHRFPESRVFDMATRLRSLLGREQITTMFVMTTRKPFVQGAEGTGSLSMAVDNVLSTTFVGEHGLGKKATAVCVRKLRGLYLPPRFVEYSLSRAKNQLVLNTKSLTDVIESKSGELSLGELYFYYFVGETCALNELAVYQDNLLVEHYPGTEQERPHMVPFGEQVRADTEKLSSLTRRENLLQSFAFHPPFARRTRTEIVMFDQPWTEALENLLIPLDDMLDPKEKKEHDEKLPANIRKAFRGKGKILGLPYYHNYFAVCYRSDLLKCVYRSENKSVKGLVNEHGIIIDGENLAWSDLLAIAKEAVAEHDKPDEGRHVVPFSYDDDSAECYASMFVSLTHARTRMPMFERHGEAIIDWLRFAHEAGAVPRSLLIKGGNARKKEGEKPEVPQSWESVFSWSWYAQILDMKTRFDSENIHCLKTSLADPVSGSWAFGILDGSLNPRRGLETIRLLLSDHSQYKMAQLRAAIPADPRKWQESWFPESERFLVEDSLDRSCIDNYLNCSRLMAEFMKGYLDRVRRLFDDDEYDVAQFSKTDEKDLNAKLSKLFKELRKLW